jgi:microcystin-dependent protein
MSVVPADVGDAAKGFAAHATNVVAGNAQVPAHLAAQVHNDLPSVNQGDVKDAYAASLSAVRGASNTAQTYGAAAFAAAVPLAQQGAAVAMGKGFHPNVVPKRNLNVMLAFARLLVSVRVTVVVIRTLFLQVSGLKGCSTRKLSAVFWRMPHMWVATQRSTV